MSKWQELVGSENVPVKEKTWLSRRRKKAGIYREQKEGEYIGVALSGGGIRSATFNLGLLQAMNRSGFLKYVDYLSTVSGGGYIGSCLTWLKIVGRDIFPFGNSRKDYSGTGGKVLAWLRCHGQYLTPGDGLTVWALIAACITGVAVNLLIVIPVFLALFYWLTINSISCTPIFTGVVISLNKGLALPDGFFLIFCLSLVSFFAYLVITLAYVVSTRCRKFCHEVVQRWFRVWMGIWLMIAVIALIVGTIPIAHNSIREFVGSDWLKATLSSISLSGLISFGAGLIGRTEQNETRGVRSLLMGIGLSLIVYGIFLYMYQLVIELSCSTAASYLIYAGMGISLFLAIFADINHVSMHRFYRNRLREAYMPYDFSPNGGDTGKASMQRINATARDADYCYLSTIQQAETDTPYHIINTNLQTVGSGNPKLKRRGGENFVLSPYYCGSDNTDWLETERYAGGETDLATAMAISGAAVDPNTYATRSRPLSFLMTLFNVRLGYWARNPKVKDKCYKPLRAPAWYYYIFREMLGVGLNENCHQVHLSDGGHFENLAVYELIRRRCRLIVASDAGCDPAFSFSDLAKLIELVRVDFGAELSLCTDLLQPAEATGISKLPYAIGTIKYINGEEGSFIYVKSTLVKELSEDIYGYKRKDGSFPDQTTNDQFFDEQQFEAYRELGFSIGMMLFGDEPMTEEGLQSMPAVLRARQAERS
ncbi:hypothetical protein [Desulfosediminicola sp.]|uniref:hypothetical protein n=1 Tax=Desulfosediminicola sp. TaxID=2886825 RepID=UPI003AF24B8C